MRNFFSNHYDKILIVLAILFMATVVFMYVWGANFLFGSFNSSTELKNASGGFVHFNIEGARNLGLSP